MFDLFSVYSFTTLSPAILGGQYKTMKVVGILDYEAASQYRDVLGVNEQVLPDLNNPPIPEEQEYILFENGDNKLILSKSWIDPPSITQDADVTINIVISNASVNDKDILRGLLKGLGYNAVVT